MPQDAFKRLISAVTSRIGDRPLDDTLEAELNLSFAPSSDTYRVMVEACLAGIEAGWMCSRTGGGIRYGRVIKPGPETHGFSVDVVDMHEVVGPHHSHPLGEIDLVMPLTATAKFDGRGAGWKVYGPGSSHSPTVTDGRALVLYLLPAGKIEFTDH